MKEFATIKDMRKNKALQNMHRYEHEKVMIGGKEVHACTTNQQYEDIIWGKLESIFRYINIEYKENLPCDELASVSRDFILKLMEKNGVVFANVFEDY